jgi:hypothetical protein
VCKENDADQDEDAAVIALAQEIRAYLEDRPNAEDSLRGVVQWWLARQRYRKASQVVRKALDYLEKQGLVERRRRADGQETYAGKRRARQH